MTFKCAFRAAVVILLATCVSNGAQAQSTTLKPVVERLAVTVNADSRITSWAERVDLGHRLGPRRERGLSDHVVGRAGVPGPHADRRRRANQQERVEAEFG